jgi:putative sigma-54 modulation protein
VQIKISARHGHLNDSQREFIREKAQKLLHFFGRLTQIEVTVDWQNHAPVVEVLVSAEHKKDFVAQEKNGDLMTAVEVAVNRLEGQLRKYKEKVQDHRRDPSAGELAGGQGRGETSGEE